MFFVYCIDTTQQSCYVFRFANTVGLMGELCEKSSYNKELHAEILKLLFVLGKMFNLKQSCFLFEMVEKYDFIYY